MEINTIVAVVLWGLVLFVNMCFRFLTGLAKDLDETTISKRSVTCISVELVLRTVLWAVLPLGASIAGMTLPARLRELILMYISPDDVSVACVVALFALFVAIKPLKEVWRGGIRARFLELLRPPPAGQDGQG